MPALAKHNISVDKQPAHSRHSVSLRQRLAECGQPETLAAAVASGAHQAPAVALVHSTYTACHDVPDGRHGDANSLNQAVNRIQELINAGYETTKPVTFAASDGSRQTQSDIQTASSRMCR